MEKSSDEVKSEIPFTKKPIFYIMVGIAAIVLVIVTVAKLFNIDLLDTSSYSDAIVETYNNLQKTVQNVNNFIFRKW